MTTVSLPRSRTYFSDEDCVVPQTTGSGLSHLGDKYVLGGKRSSRFRASSRLRRQLGCGSRAGLAGGDCEPMKEAWRTDFRGAAQSRLSPALSAPSVLDDVGAAADAAAGEWAARLE